MDWVNNPSFSNQVGLFPVLFFGSINERRQKIIDDLRAADIQTVTLVGYGSYRDKYIQRAKIVLNLHYYDSSIFEIFRVAHLLANEKCVVSESGKDESLEAPYRGAIEFSPYDGIVEKCRELLDNDTLRDRAEKGGFKAINSRSQKDILEKLLEK